MPNLHGSDVSASFRLFYGQDVKFYKIGNYEKIYNSETEICDIIIHAIALIEI